MSKTEKKTLGIAIASLIFGCLIFMQTIGIIFSPVALILGIISIIKISKNKNNLQGKGFAIAGISLGSFGIIALLIVALLPPTAKPKLIKAQNLSQESAASAALWTIAATELEYKLNTSNYATLLELGGTTPPYIDLTLAQGTKQGYKFTLTTDKKTYFYATAVPEAPNTNNTLYVNNDGVLCRSDNVNTPAPTTYVGKGCPSGFSERE